MVWVKAQTSWALDDIGDARSPKKIPESTAPPLKSGSKPSTSESIMQMTPTVPAVPKEVPVKKETTEQSKNVQRTK